VVAPQERMTVEQARTAGLLDRSGRPVKKVSLKTSRARDAVGDGEREVGRRGVSQGVCSVTGCEVFGSDTAMVRHIQRDHPWKRGCITTVYLNGYVPPGRAVWSHG